MRLAHLIAAAVMAVTSIVPAAASPAGVWELETRDTRFALELCGDGTQLCGQLVWLSDHGYNDRYRPYLNASMADRLRAAGPNRWRGEMRLFGYSLSGTITQQSDDQLTLHGCALLVVCRTYRMFRISE